MSLFSRQKRVPSLLSGVLLLAVLGPAVPARAELKPEKVFTADSKKTQFYVRDGLITGGDKQIEDVVIKDIRRAVNPAGYERIVIDLEGTIHGEAAAIPRPPYFQAAVSPEEKRVVFSIWGNPKLGFDSRKVVGGFKKSPSIESIELFPRLDERVWTFSMDLRKDQSVEVFELTHPVRIIIDLKTATR